MSTSASPNRPAGDPYDWYTRARDLHDGGHPAAAAELFEHLLAVEPPSASVLEAAARAHFDSGRYGESAARFAAVVELRPDDDYAHYGLGMSLWRLKDFVRAGEHLAMAAAMRPDREYYTRALSQVRATQRARREAGLPDIEDVP